MHADLARHRPAWSRDWQPKWTAIFGEMACGSAERGDNRGGAAAAGGSQLVSIDPETRLPSVVFPRPGVSLPGEFYSTEAGQLELSGTGRVLVALTVGQKIWEIDLGTGEVSAASRSACGFIRTPKSIRGRTPG
jgi:hypothetical protein